MTKVATSFTGPVSDATAAGPSDLAHHSITASALLHIAPGAAAAGCYFALVPVARSVGLPSVAALAGSAIVAIMPIELSLLRHARRGDRPTIPWRRRLSARELGGWTSLTVGLAAAGFAVSAPISNLLEKSAFGWWPQSFKIDMGTSGGYSNSALGVTAGLVIAGSVITAPIVEELYFRGYLLPRMPTAFGRFSSLAHVTLFSLYHLWTPWLAPTRMLAVLPLTLAVARKKSIRIGVAAHVVINAIDAGAILWFLIKR
jgi:uncharacterized protein